MKILVINGPNINLLGLREPKIYGSQNYDALIKFINNCASELNIDVEYFQSNHEGKIIDKIQQAYGIFDGILINPAAYTHTSIAILDTLKAINLPTVEVHISDIMKREDFRKNSFIKPVCIKSFVGLGFDGYKKAMLFLKQYLEGIL